MKNSKGITLIALVITIIVMLILAGVSVTVISNGDLFGKARKARDDTQAQADAERGIISGTLEDGSIDDYVEGPVTPQDQ